MRHKSYRKIVYAVLIYAFVGTALLQCKRDSSSASDSASGLDTNYAPASMQLSGCIESGS